MPDLEQLAREIFFDALDQPNPAAREQFLGEACGTDASLRNEVELLLKSHDQAGLFLAGQEPDETTLGESTQHGGAQVGPYKLLEVIGEGGMGTVYMAQQTEPVQRRVALKVIKTGMDTRQVIARFEAERQALALMDHPNIAKVLDAGSTETGRPYFVMELVKGVPITQFCDEQRLDTESRLKLFQKVCHAVQHAHQKGIIHRDLKPSNVLVAMYDDQPVPKVIDFGVAKATGEQLTEQTMFTRYGQIVGTLEYMSPEQAQFNNLDIDTRSDIYSLGAILYELLVGEPPFERERLKSQALDETLKMIREDEPTRPSTRLSSIRRSTQAATDRRTTPERLGSILVGDLDWIVMMSLHKERTLRYETATALSDDIQRYLNDEPIVACPPSKIYRFRKFARRNKFALAFGSLAVLSLVAGTIGLVVSNHLLNKRGEETEAALKVADENYKLAQKNLLLAKENETQARTDAAITKEVNDFINSMIGKAHPDEQPNGDLRVSELLDRAMVDIEDRFNEQPLVEAQIRVTIANVLDGLGRWDEESEMLNVAHNILERELGPWHRDTLKCESMLISNQAHQSGRFLDALLELEPLTGQCISQFGLEDELSLQMSRDCADLKCHVGRSPEAEKQLRKILEIQERTLGRTDPDTQDTIKQLAGAIDDQGRHGEAEQLFQEIVDFHDKRPVTVGKLQAKEALAVVIFRQGRFDEAEQMIRDIIISKKEFLGPEHILTLHSMDNLAHALLDSGRFADAEKLCREILEIRERINPEPEHRFTWNTKFALASALSNQQQLEAAEKLIREVVQERMTARGPAHPSTLKSRKLLADILTEQARYHEAAPVYRNVLTIQKKQLRPNHPNTLATTSNLARSYWLQNQTDESIPLYEELVDHCKQELGEDHPMTLMLIGNLGVNYQAVGRFEEALPRLQQVYGFRDKNPQLHVFTYSLIDAYVQLTQMDNAKQVAEEYLSWIRDNLPPSSSQMVTALSSLCTYYFIPAEAYPRAEKLLRECLEIQESVSPDHWWTFSIKFKLGEVLCAEKQFVEAEDLLQDGYRGLLRHEKSISPLAKTKIEERMARLVKLYEVANEDANAIEWRKKLESFQTKKTTDNEN